MPRTKAELARAAAGVEAWLDTLDPDTMVEEKAADLADLRRVAELGLTIERTRADLEAAVIAARGNGRSWARIGMALGMTRQAAQERFEPKPARPRARSNRPASQGVHREQVGFVEDQTVAALTVHPQAPR